MKKHVLVSLAVSATLAVAALTAPMAQSPVSASANGEKRYFDAIATRAYGESTVEYIDYTTYEDPTVTTVGGMPSYYVSNHIMQNACGPVAGTVVAGFYDHYYGDLIPNYSTWLSFANCYYPMNDTYILPVMQEMYTLMRTNVDDVGVSEYDCKDGLEAYVESKDLSLSYSSVKSGSSFNYTAYKNAINANKPVLLFCTDITEASLGFNDDTNQSSIVKMPTTGSHIVVGYGYCTAKYYNNGTLFRTESFIMAINGKSINDKIWIHVNDMSTCLDAGYAVTVTQ